MDCQELNLKQRAVRLERMVLLTLGRLEIGGAEMRTLRLLQEIQRRHDPFVPVVFIVSGKAGRLDEDFRRAGARLIFGCRGTRGLLEFYRVCKRERPDIVHISAALAGGFYTLAAWCARVPKRIAHLRSTGYNRTGKLFALRNRIYRVLLNQFSTRVVGVCNAAQLQARTPPRKWLTIYNGVDPVPGVVIDASAIEQKDRLDVVFLGRMQPEKNPLKAILIFRALVDADKTVPARLHFFGDDRSPLGDEARRLVWTLGLHDRVRFHGPTDDPMTSLRNASVLLLTSTREGLPGVVLEALSCGTPVVASKLPGVEEIAKQTSGVTIVGSSQTDEEWALALIQAAAGADRLDVAESLCRSPFTFDRHYQEVIRLWQS